MQILEFSKPRISNNRTQHGGEIAEHNKSVIENHGSRFAKAQNIAQIQREDRYKIIIAIMWFNFILKLSSLFPPP